MALITSLGCLRMLIVVLIRSPELRAANVTLITTLTNHLLENHPNSYIRPVYDDSISTNVEYSIDIQYLLEVDTVAQKITVVIWRELTWFDQYLRWDPELYENETKIKLPPDVVWTPQFLVFNRVSNHNSPDKFVYPLEVSHNGQVVRTEFAIIMVRCGMNMKYYPNDNHTCSLIHTTVDSKDDVNISAFHAHYDNSSFGSSEYEILAVHTERPGEDGERDGQILEIKIEISRSSSFISDTVKKPVLLLYLIVLASFLLPPDSEAKIDILMNTFIAFSVYVLILSDKIPPSKDAPVLLEHLSRGMTINLFATITAVISIRISGIESIKPDKMAVKVMNYLGKILLLPGSQPLLKCDKDEMEHRACTKEDNKVTALEDNLVHQTLSDLQDWLKDQKEEGEIKDFWRQTSCVLDRVAFVSLLLFLIVYAGSDLIN